MKRCTIDTNIWITFFNQNNPGHENTKTWFTRNIGKFDAITLSVIIALEILHNLTKDPRVEYETPFSFVFSLINLKNVEVIDLTNLRFKQIAKMLARVRDLGVGGRDTAIIQPLNMGDTIITHDKNLLMLQDYIRIDPLFEPPLILEVKEKFDNKLYKEMVKSQLE